MKNLRCYVAVLVGFGVFALCGSAQALVFAVSDISFPTISGNIDPPGFQWSVSANTNFDLPDLDVGDIHTFTYGTFFTDAFPINGNEAADNDDFFTVNFYVSPPTSPTLLNKDGFPDAMETATVGTNSGAAWVLFNDDWIDKTFGNGGLYRVKFLEIESFSGDSTHNLQAMLEYLRAPTNGDSPTVVPEPSTVLLLGSGLLGLFYVGRKRRK